MSEDANDIYKRGGVEAVRFAFDNSGTGDGCLSDPERPLEVGSEAEVASRVVENLRLRFGHVVYAEGDIWRWTGRHWQKLLEAEFYPFIKHFDGQTYQSENSKKASVWRLSDRTRKGIQRLVALQIQDDQFFRETVVGINVKNGFIRFDDGVPMLEPHQPVHRLRHILEADWNGDILDHPPNGKLLHTLIEGSFRGDDDSQAKAFMLAEVAACAVLGMGTKLASPKAIVLYGPSAGNGKSRFLALFRALIPETSTTTLTAQQLGDERMRATSPGVLLNTADELGSAAIQSDTFKGAITGEKTAARQVYAEPVMFNPIAQHVFATNSLPPFSDGLDAGVLRRIQLIPFNRTIPEDERIADIDKLIVALESELLLSWVIAGAIRLLEQAVSRRSRVDARPSGSGRTCLIRSRHGWMMKTMSRSRAITNTGSMYEPHMERSSAGLPT